MTVELCRETYRRLTDAKLATTYSRQHLSNTVRGVGRTTTDGSMHFTGNWRTHLYL